MANRENFKKVKDRIEENRVAALSLAEAHNEEVRRRSPRIREIDDELQKTGLTLFRTACAGGDIEPLRARNLALNEERKAELVKLGLPEDYTDVHYTCPFCSDTGYVDTVMCRCLREGVIKENIRSSGMGNLIERQSFENFDLSAVGDENATRVMEKILKNLKKYAETFSPKTSANLLFMGATGTGKTHLSTAMAKVIIERGFEVLYDSAQNIVSSFEDDHFHRGFTDAAPESDKYLTCDLLIIDDLGTEFTSQFSYSALFNLFNTRANRGLPTVVSTNLTDAQIRENYDNRLYSRLFGADFILIPFAGNDHRLK